MSGRINRIVASLVLEGLRRTTPGALEHEREADVRAVLSAGDEGAPLDAYRRILGAARAADGGIGLLRSGGSLGRLVRPLLFVLLNSDSRQVLLEK